MNRLKQRELTAEAQSRHTRACEQLGIRRVVPATASVTLLSASVNLGAGSSKSSASVVRTASSGPRFAAPYRSASSGRMRIAESAGRRPPKTPIAIENAAAHNMMVEST